MFQEKSRAGRTSYVRGGDGLDAHEVSSRRYVEEPRGGLEEMQGLRRLGDELAVHLFQEIREGDEHPRRMAVRDLVEQSPHLAGRRTETEDFRAYVG